jgi:hypothetical protein
LISFLISTYLHTNLLPLNIQCPFKSVWSGIVSNLWLLLLTYSYSSSTAVIIASLSLHRVIIDNDRFIDVIRTIITIFAIIVVFVINICIIYIALGKQCNHYRIQFDIYLRSSYPSLPGFSLLRCWKITQKHFTQLQSQKQVTFNLTLSSSVLFPIPYSNLVDDYLTSNVVTCLHFKFRSEENSFIIFWYSFWGGADNWGNLKFTI